MRKLFILITLCRSLVKLSTSKTIHMPAAANQLAETRSAICVLAGVSEEAVKQNNELLTSISIHQKQNQILKATKIVLLEEISTLEKQKWELEKQNCLLAQEIKSWENKQQLKQPVGELGIV